MMQKVNLKRITALARHLPKFLVVCVMCSIIFIGGSGKFIFGGSSSPPADCNVKQEVSLYPEFPYQSEIQSRRSSFCFFPAGVYDDFHHSQGSPALTFNSSNGWSASYFCKITVTSDCDTKEYVWSNAADFIKISVPTQTQYRVTVQYYESCNNCNKDQNGGTLNDARLKLYYSAVHNQATDIYARMVYDYYQLCN